ncbi:MAG TPA: DUF4124 domain-containing protein [Burkholderiaceae bacterium]|nr:DUF4124 domain-containing protein [Burkholderiaceae bacterium]
MLRLVLVLGLALPGAIAAQTIYKVQTPEGSILFTDSPPPGSKVLEERSGKPTAKPPANVGGGAPAKPIVLPGTGPDPSAALAAPPKVNALDAAMQEIAAAETALQVAKRRLELGREPLPGERLGLAGGGTRLSPDYESRVAGLEREVADAEARVAKAYAARNAVR